MRAHREPFFGMPEDLALLPEGERERFQDQKTEAQLGGAVAELGTRPGVDATAPTQHPDAVEKGISLPLGFIPHRVENRTQRRAAVANFAHPDVSRRELLKQRQKHRRGKLDIETRRLQRKATK